MRIESMIFRFGYFAANWKMILHLLFRTDHFGVNNDTWSQHRSIFGLSVSKTLTRLILNYRMMRLRAFIGFIPLNDAIRLFPGYAKKCGYRPIDPL